MCPISSARLPAGFTYVAFVHLSDNGTPPEEIAILFYN